MKIPRALRWGGLILGGMAAGFLLTRLFSGTPDVTEKIELERTPKVEISAPSPTGTPLKSEIHTYDVNLRNMLLRRDTVASLGIGDSETDCYTPSGEGRLAFSFRPLESNSSVVCYNTHTRGDGSHVGSIVFILDSQDASNAIWRYYASGSPPGQLSLPAAPPPPTSDPYSSFRDFKLPKIGDENLIGSIGQVGEGGDQYYFILKEGQIIAILSGVERGDSRFLNPQIMVELAGYVHNQIKTEIENPTGPTPDVYR